MHRYLTPVLAGVLAIPLAQGEGTGAEPLYTVPGSFELRTEGGRASLAIFDEQGAEFARYDLGGCRFTSGAHTVRNGDGVFELLFHGATEPILAAVCRPAAGGRRLSVLVPKRDAGKSVLEVTGDSKLSYRVGLDSLAVTRERGSATVEELWHPGVQGRANELAWVRDHVEAAEGRRMPAAEPTNDSDFHALSARLTEIATARDVDALVALAAPEIRLSFGGMSGAEMFRDMIAGADFWPEFDRVLEGGGVLRPGWETGREAIFPAAFETWPDELDGYGHYYGDRREAKLRAGPSETAPLLADLFGRIVAAGPHLQGGQRLYEAGWVQVCTVEEGCGFARAEHIRSPIDWRAIFTQAAEGEPWVLETYIAGD